jgi:hypothetical protein
MINEIIRLVDRRELNSSLRCIAKEDNVVMLELEPGTWYGNTSEGVIYYAYEREIGILKQILKDNILIL